MRIFRKEIFSLDDVNVGRNTRPFQLVAIDLESLLFMYSGNELIAEKSPTFYRA